MASYKVTFAADLKLIMIILGLQSNSSCHPCPWCGITKLQLEKVGKIRTFQSIEENYKKWIDETGGDLKKSKFYGNCTNIPLVSDADRSSEIIKTVTLPELHLLMGVVQHFYEYVKKENESVAEEWIIAASIQVDHFQRFNGNNARKLLKKVHVLEEIDDSNKYIKIFKKFNCVVESCFGQELDSSFMEKIAELEECLLESKIKFTPKLHAVIHHVPNFCSETERGLGYFSEQCSEQVHHDFKKHTENFYVNIKSPDCQQKLLRSVCAYNSKHI